MNAAPRAGIERICVQRTTPVLEVMRAQTGAPDDGVPAGIALVVEPDGRLAGTVTDGDIRRALIAGASLDAPAEQVMREGAIAFLEGTPFREIVRRIPEELARRNRRSQRFLGKVILTDADGRPVRVLDYHQLWEQRVATHRNVVVVGMGYVGLTLALTLAEEGFAVVGVDVDPARVEMLRRGESPLHELGLPQLLREQLGRNFHVQAEMPHGDVFLVAVGTPTSSHDGEHVPDLSMLEAATRMVASRLPAGGLVVLRSTVPLGTTRDVVLPILERETGLRGGTDFHLAFAPERTIEGMALAELRELPQLIAGLNDDSCEATVALFRELTATIVRMESLEAAELAKLINNAYRDVSFAFANQIAMVASAFDFDVVEAIRAANHAYPRNPVPLPSPGVGGPCLTKDPYILATSATRAGIADTLFEAGRRVNEAIPATVADALVKQLEDAGKEPGRCTVLLCGLAFKGHPETDDLRGSPALDIARLLHGRVGRVLGQDPVVEAPRIVEAGLEPVTLPEGAAGVDAIVFVNNHRSYAALDIFEITRSLRAPGIVYDGWRLFRPDDVLRSGPCVYMGVGLVRTSPAEHG